MSVLKLVNQSERGSLIAHVMSHKTDRIVYLSESERVEDIEKLKSYLHNLQPTFLMEMAKFGRHICYQMFPLKHENYHRHPRFNIFEPK